MFQKMYEALNDAEKLTDLLYEFFERRGIVVDIKEYQFDFEFHFDIRGLELSALSKILSTLTELNKGVLIEYDVEVQLYEPTLTAYFDQKQYEDSDEESKFVVKKGEHNDDLGEDHLDKMMKKYGGSPF